MKNIVLLWQYRELLWNLAHREISQRYKQSILGYAWVLLNPLFQMVVVSFVFSIILRIPSQGVPFIIFLSAALLPWNFFLNSLTSSANALVGNSPLITKIYFPREILVYSTIIAKIVDFLFSCIILIGFIMVFQLPFYPTLLFFPIILLVQIIFLTGIALMVASFNLFYRDIQYLLSLILTLWMYLTPVMYPADIIPDKYRFIFSLNPMAVIVDAYRQVILSGQLPNMTTFLTVSIIAVITFAIGLFIFKSQEGRFADYV